ncbi:MAG: hypothetical protein ABIK98_10910 [Pseudomonadota bacterium]|uniref:Uncharacterized protein n=1 Tax=Candidatus Desulfatibia profunda TaxID=2841695 RepID=A0A8J6NT08_9BACT|nr:hypothetical protein [Candidatus Desulfatibia profunda]MBL7179101.1 hypothetical protein [Desulfobacterales bacterium]
MSTVEINEALENMSKKSPEHMNMVRFTHNWSHQMLENQAPSKTNEHDS